MIELRNVSKIYDKKVYALNNVSLNLPSEGLVVILGASGSGKTTLLNILSLLDTPSSGSVLFHGKDISKFNEKRVTSYRASEIGFIFQDFNLFDNLTVFDNIKLSADLKGFKKHNSNIIKCLEILKLDNLKNKKVKYLSGGEKQRVAIARALIKNPSIILADEPTGNLDSSNSKVIFETLKYISKKRLVVLVTHDEDSANNYADYIIRLKDGHILNESDAFINKSYEYPSKDIRSYHISIKEKIKFAFSMLFKKKIRLLLMIIVLSISLTLFCFSLNIKDFDINKIHAKTMVDNNETTMYVSKSGLNANSYNLVNYLIQDDLDYLKSFITSSIVKYSSLYFNNNIADFSEAFNIVDFSDDYENNAYYQALKTTASTNFIVKSEEELKSLDIYGNLPSSGKEVLISELLADYMTTRGYSEPAYEERLGCYYEQETHVEKKEDLIGKKVYISLYEYITIAGIIKDPDLEKYESLKNEEYDEQEHSPSSLYQEFKDNYQYSLFTLVVNEDFFNNDWTENERLDADLYPNEIDFESESIYDEFNIGFSDEVGKDEIILSYSLVYDLYRSEVNTKHNELISKANKEGLDTSNLQEEAYKYVIDKHNMIGNYLTLKITDYEGNIIEKKLKIVGTTVSDALINKEVFKEFISPHELINYLKINEDDETTLEDLLNALDKTNYTITTTYSSDMTTISGIVSSLDKISIYISIGFLVLSLILIILFLTNNFIINKKQIGILRAIGTKLSDVMQIFTLEGIILTFISIILSSILTYSLIIIVNNYLTSELGYLIKILYFNNKSILYMIVIVVIMLIISLIIPLIKISKDKPIKSIRN